MVRGVTGAVGGKRSRGPLSPQPQQPPGHDEFNWDEPALDLLERLDLDHNRLTGEIS